MSFKIKHFNDVPKEQWDDFVYSNSMGWAYFLHDIIKIFRQDSYVNESFAILGDKNEILFVIQLHKSPKNILISQWGFCIKDNLPHRQLKKLQTFFENYIDFYIKEHKINRFSIDFAPLTEANLPDACNCVNPGMVFGFEPIIRYTYLVDLSKPDDRMLADCKETTRQAIRKLRESEKYSVIESDGSQEDCEEYIKLHRDTYTRCRAFTFMASDSYIKYVFSKLIPDGHCRVFFLKDNDKNEYVAGIIILMYKKTAYYWWGCSKEEKDVGINKYLLFEAMCKIREFFGKTGYFEIGGAYPHLRDGKYKGLNDYKKSFGTFLHPIFQGLYQIEFERKKVNICGLKINLRLPKEPDVKFEKNLAEKEWIISES